MSPELPAPIGESRPFLELLEAVSRVAPLDRPVLVIGERGTGKELIAARLHYLSRRWGQAFVKVNCAALAETLLETELFGHEAGAFTGATRRRAGRFEAADGGSLFLDEIANASAPAQEKVLRVIEYGEFERVGSNDPVRVDVRVVGATNVDLPSAAETGRFRHDLLDRLAFDVLTVPPLRARPEDIPLLAAHFGRAMAAELGWPAFPGFADAAMELLLGHGWPGNVRELRNTVERAVYRWPNPDAPVAAVLLDPFASPFRPAAGRAERPTAQARPEPPAEPDLPVDLRAAVAGTERRLVERALASARHNRRDAARLLGLSYDQLRHLLRKHPGVG